MSVAYLALGASTLVVLPVAGVVAAGAWVYRFAQGRRLDRRGGAR